LEDDGLIGQFFAGRNFHDNDVRNGSGSRGRSLRDNGAHGGKGQREDH
jgi:hypothetical protein